MSGEIVLLGGSFTSERLYIGLVNELRVDTSNKALRLHDGVTLGGMPFLNADAIASQYQAKSPELDGLLGFAPEGRGQVTRIAPATYALREIVDDGTSITITNGDGRDDNPTVGLASHITSDHSFDGNLTVAHLIVGAGGISCSGALYAAGAVQFDDHVTADQFVVRAMQANEKAIFAGGIHVSDSEPVEIPDAALAIAKIAGLQAALDSISTALTKLPGIGFIGLWAGSVGSIPTGWHLCDGGSGTPDLRDRFVLGAGNTYAPGATGGATTHTHTATIAADGVHSHAITVDGHALTISEMPSHSHGNGVSDDNVGNIFPYGVKGAPSGGNVNNDPGTNTQQGISESIGGGAAHAHTASSATAGSHAHGIAIDAHDNTPPYYALCYIMRIS